MKEITKVKTVEEVVGYEASDGTVFKTEEECEKYEQTADYVIKERFKKLVVKEMEGCAISDIGSAFCMAAVDEDWFYALVEIKNEDDLRIAQMYHKINGYGESHGFTTEMIGKRVIVSIGEGIYPRPKEGKKCNYDECCVYGTIEKQIEKYEKALRRLEEVNDNGKQTTDM